MTSITSGSGFSYELTPSDLLWLARAVKYEGGNEVATAWSLAQRFVELREKGMERSYPTFASLIRAYAQPVNPIWMRNGSMCRPGGTWYDRCRGSYCPCEESRLAVRDRAASDPAEEQLELMTRWASGELPNPVPRGVEYAAPFVIEPKFERGELFPVLQEDRDNWYGANETSLSWPSSYVKVNGTGERSSAGLWIGLGLGIAATIGVGAWWLSRR